MEKVIKLNKTKNFEGLTFKTQEQKFLYLTKNTPMVNVDLLIKNKNNETLLSWRNDEFCGQGWHIPGGVIRHCEKMFTRVQKVLTSEIGIFDFDDIEIEFSDIHELIYPELTARNHFISFLYKIFLNKDINLEYINKYKEEADIGYLKWFDKCPDNLIKIHKKIYKELI